MVALPALTITFFAFAAALVLAGLSQSHTAQHGSESSTSFWLDMLKGGALLGFLKDLLGLGARAGRYVVSKFAAAQIRLLGSWLVAAGTLVIGWLTVLPQLAEATADALEHIAGHGDAKARARAKAAGSAAAKAARAANAAGAHAGTNAKALNRYKAVTNRRLHVLHRSVAVTLPHEIGRVRAREKVLARDQARLRERTTALEDGAIKTWDWIRSHPVSVAAGAFAGAVAVALDRLGLGSIRCPSLRSMFGRRGCGLWNGLESLLGWLVDGFLITNLCDLINPLADVFAAIATPLIEAFGAATDVACGGAANAAAPLEPPAYVPPAYTYDGRPSL